MKETVDLLAKISFIASFKGYSDKDKERNIIKTVKNHYRDV